MPNMCEIRNNIFAQLTSNIKQSVRNSLVLKEAQYDKVEYASGCIALASVELSWTQLFKAGLELTLLKT